MPVGSLLLVTSFKADDLSQKAVTLVKETKLKEIGVFTALDELTERSKTCLLSELHLVAYRALTGQHTLYEGCVKMEEIARTRVLPEADKLEKQVILW